MFKTVNLKLMAFKITFNRTIKLKKEKFMRVTLRFVRHSVVCVYVVSSMCVEKLSS